MTKQVTAIIVGAGHRALLYASFAEMQPERFKIIGVADPNAFRRKETAERFGFGEDMCFESAEALAATGKKMADCIINGTMDEDHVPTSVPLLRLGYDMLLEKPFAINETEMFYLLDVARENHAKVMICHVLRYAPFYRAIKDILLSGEIGEVIALRMSELVSYHHAAVSFVRGKWGNSDLCGAPFLLAKCCHDMDLMIWLKGVKPAEITSQGSDFQFAEFKKPAGSADRCLDCAYVDTCDYSAKGHYLDHPDRWAFYVWDAIEHIENPTLADKEASLRGNNIHGRCVWNCNHKNIDHQLTTVNFTDGSTGVLNLIAGTAKPDRDIHIVGTHGEIQGSFESAKFTVRTIVPSAPTGYEERVVDLHMAGDASGAFGVHGGGDIRMVEDFVAILEGNEPSISATSLDDSILGHLAVFKAEEARKERRVVNILPDLVRHGVLRNSDMDAEVYKRIMNAD